MPSGVNRAPGRSSRPVGRARPRTHQDGVRRAKLRPAAPRWPTQVRRWPLCWPFLAVVTAGAGVQAAGPGSQLAAALPVATGLATLAAIGWGLAVHRPSHPLPWWLAVAAIGLLLSGAALRGSGAEIGRAPLISDVLTFPGYLLLLATGVQMLRVRRSMRHRGALLDAAILGLGMALGCWQLLVEPAIGAGSGVLRTALTIGYPAVDVVILLVLSQLAFTDASRVVSYWLFAWACAALLAGDLLWNSAAAGAHVALTAVSAPYLLAYGLLGASMLHPSMRRLTENQTQPAREVMPVARIAMITAVLAGPTALSLRANVSHSDRWLLVAGAITLSVLIIVRTARAVNGFAEQVHQAQYTALHDPLTGLPNREYLLAHLDNALADISDPSRAESGSSVAVLFADLDGFKLINDSWGHDVGDQLLILVARRMRSSVRSSDLVARIGGDEFVIAIVDPDPTAAIDSAARRLRADLSTPFRLSHGEVFVSASMGAGWRTAADLDQFAPPPIGPPRREVAAEILREADTAMYQAKAEGRQRLKLFDVSLRQRVRIRLDMQTALRRALDREELTLAYQPVVDLESGMLLGWEALARWTRPESGPVSPAEFIPVAEEAGLIVPLGAWVLGEAVAQLARWRHLLEMRGRADRAEVLSMSLNVAERQLRDDKFVPLVAETLRRCQVPPGQVCLEITESTLLVDDASSGEVISALRRLGVDLAVDDFGTGYSALSYLTRYPFTRVKIDQSFVADMETSADAAAIVTAVVAMARALNLRLVAEGVETEVQASMLRAVGCQAGQGYLFGRPMPAAEATRQLLATLGAPSADGRVAVPIPFQVAGPGQALVDTTHHTRSP
jgi:diguanylate cyclase (GGDEF)-like protein